MSSDDVLQLKSQLAELKTSVAVINNNLGSISEFLTSMKKTSEKIYEIHTDMAVQDNVMSNFDKRITSIEANIKSDSEEEQEFRKYLDDHLENLKKDSQVEREKCHVEVIKAIDKLSTKIDHQDEKITKLEKWRWYIVGIVTAITFIASKIPWDKIIG